MISVAICDDEMIALEMIYKYVKQNFQEVGIEAKITMFSSGKKLLKDIENGNKYDVFFLDVDMPDGNGILIAKNIRKDYKDAFIIFITNHREYVFTTFKVNTFRFIRKKYLKVEIKEAVEAVCNELVEKDEVSVVFDDHNNIVRLKLSHIIYIEGLKQLINIILVDRDISIKYKMMDAEKLLEEQGFIRVHKSYLVNYKHIHNIQKDQVIMDTGEVLPISRYRIKDVKDQFFELTKKLNK